MLKLWRLQNLTLEGRITTSKIIHLALVKTIPNATIDQLSKMQKDFILNKMKWKIKNSILHSNLHDGGLINVNIKSKIISLQGAWVILQYLQLFITNMHNWKILPLGLIHKYLWKEFFTFRNTCPLSLVKQTDTYRH